MSLYNMMNGFNAACIFILPMLGRKREEYPRFRDCYVTKFGEIAIYTRVGGGNRECGFGEDELYADPHFIRTFDDTYDDTYGTYLFRVPSKWQKDFDNIMLGKWSEVSDDYVSLLKTFNPGEEAEKSIDKLCGRAPKQD